MYIFKYFFSDTKIYTKEMQKQGKTLQDERIFPI